MMQSKKEIKLSTGAIVSVDDHRVRVDLPPSPTFSSYQSISSAILNGGCHIFPSSSSPTTTHHVINYQVPATYDGLNPPPLGLLTNFAKKEKLESTNTVGLLTAASMQSFAMASRTAQGVSIDVLVTAGLSNSRSAGADADYFVVCEDDDADGQELTPGTINTIIIVNAPLTLGAQVEAYAIAIEAKGSACVNHGVVCAKAITYLKNGVPIMAFPEGQRSPTGRLMDFKGGIFSMAVKANVPIVPLSLANTHAVMPTAGFLPVQSGEGKLRVGDFERGSGGVVE